MSGLERKFRTLIAKDQVLDDLANGTALAVTKPEMGLYIRHEDVQTPSNGWALFGPFSHFEIKERLNGPYADLLAQSGDVDAVEYTYEEAANFYINSRDWWMEQEAASE